MAPRRKTGGYVQEDWSPGRQKQHMSSIQSEVFGEERRHCTFSHLVFKLLVVETFV